MGSVIEIILVWVSIMTACGAVGYKIAKQQNRNPFVGLALAAMVPLVGIGILIIIGNKSEK